jgi:hypothetical protein
MRAKTTIIPSWVKEIHFIKNGIDGWPPSGIPDSMGVEEFLSKFKALDSLEGAGEWDILIYGIQYPGVPCSTYHPYGQSNPYRRLRSTKDNRAIYLGMLSYMHYPINFKRK